MNRVASSFVEHSRLKSIAASEAGHEWFSVNPEVLGTALIAGVICAVLTATSSDSLIHRHLSDKVMQTQHVSEFNQASDAVSAL